jgi:hypothetical protein
VIEVLYVQDCPHYPATLALVERMRAELEIDAELRPSLVLDQAAAEGAPVAGAPPGRGGPRPGRGRAGPVSGLANGAGGRP